MTPVRAAVAAYVVVQIAGRFARWALEWVDLIDSAPTETNP